jgi:hypothetical protein
MSHYDFSTFFPADFVILRLVSTAPFACRLFPISGSPAVHAPSGAWFFCIPHTGAASSGAETLRSLTFPGYPFSFALFLDPGGTSPSGFTMVQCCSRLVQLQKLPRLYKFRGSIARHLRLLSTLHAPKVALEHARLASDCLPDLAGRDFHPLGNYRKFQNSISGLSSFSELS